MSAKLAFRYFHLYLYCSDMKSNESHSVEESNGMFQEIDDLEGSVFQHSAKETFHLIHRSAQAFTAQRRFSWFENHAKITPTSKSEGLSLHRRTPIKSQKQSQKVKGALWKFNEQDVAHLGFCWYAQWMLNMKANNMARLCFIVLCSISMSWVWRRKAVCTILNF